MHSAEESELGGDPIPARAGISTEGMGRELTQQLGACVCAEVGALLSPQSVAEGKVTLALVARVTSCSACKTEREEMLIAEHVMLFSWVPSDRE